MPFGRRHVHRAITIYKYVAEVLKYTSLRDGSDQTWIDSRFTASFTQRQREMLQWVTDEEVPSILDRALMDAKSRWYSFMEVIEDKFGSDANEETLGSDIIVSPRSETILLFGVQLPSWHK